MLEDGVCTTREIDLGLMAGAGSVPRRGLLLLFLKADAARGGVVLERLEALEAEHGERLALLDDAAPPGSPRAPSAPSSGQGFYAYPEALTHGDQAETVKLETRGDVAIAWLGDGLLRRSLLARWPPATPAARLMGFAPAAAVRAGDRLVLTARVQRRR